MRKSHTSAALIGLAFLIAAPLAAQSSESPSPRGPSAWHPQPSQLTASPNSDPTPLAHDQSSNHLNLQIDEEGPHHSQAVALMLVGAAGLVTGLIVDEDILTIVGAGVAGVGLYLYLR